LRRDFLEKEFFELKDVWIVDSHLTEGTSEVEEVFAIWAAWTCAFVLEVKRAIDRKKERVQGDQSNPCCAESVRRLCVSLQDEIVWVVLFQGKAQDQKGKKDERKRHLCGNVKEGITDHTFLILFNEGIPVKDRNGETRIASFFAKVEIL